MDAVRANPQQGAARHALLRLVAVMLDGDDEREVLWGGHGGDRRHRPVHRRGGVRRAPRSGAALPTGPGGGLRRRPAREGGGAEARGDSRRRSPRRSSGRSCDRRAARPADRRPGRPQPEPPRAGRAVGTGHRATVPGYLPRLPRRPVPDHTLGGGDRPDRSARAADRNSPRAPHQAPGRAGHQVRELAGDPVSHRGPAGDQGRESSRPCTNTQDSRPSRKTASATRRPGRVPARSTPGAESAAKHAPSRRTDAGTP